MICQWLTGAFRFFHNLGGVWIIFPHAVGYLFGRDCGKVGLTQREAVHAIQPSRPRVQAKCQAWVGLCKPRIRHGPGRYGADCIRRGCRQSGGDRLSHCGDAYACGFVGACGRNPKANRRGVSTGPCSQAAWGERRANLRRHSKETYRWLTTTILRLRRRQSSPDAERITYRLKRWSASTRRETRPSVVWRGEVYQTTLAKQTRQQRRPALAGQYRSNARASR